MQALLTNRTRIVSTALVAALFSWGFSAQAQTVAGYESLFMGHSFFNPVAMGLEIHPAQAGIADHSQTGVYTGGCRGAPLTLWNDPAHSAALKAELDTGNVELFGMTYHGCAPTTEGYELWFDYALSKNPDTVFFVGVPWPDFPEQNFADAAAYASNWASLYDPLWLPFMDSLLALYPNEEIFSIPYGQAAVELYTLFEAGNLPDVSSLTGAANDALFTDTKGHPGDILVDTAELIWLSAIYGVDLDTYAHDPGYITDIKAIARDIVDAHNPAYNGPQAPPAPAPANMVDNFDGGNTTYPWQENGTWYISGETYNQDDITGYKAAYAGNLAWTDYTFKADMITVSSADPATGWMAHSLAFRVSDTQNLYWARLGTDGELQLRKNVGGTNTLITSTPTGYSPFVWQSYKIVVSGDSIKVSINDELLIDISDSDHAAGGIGVRTSLSSTSVDNVTVTQPAGC